MIKPLIVLVAVGPEKAPAEVMVPEPVVEMFPEVVIAPEPALTEAKEATPAPVTLH
jgi:hypothetical protein